MKVKIDEFITKQHCANICCIDEAGHPYCFSCFYTYDKENTLLYFKSSENTKHGNMMLKNRILAGSILPDKLNFLQIKGIQLQGRLIEKGNSLGLNASSQYYKQHPTALAMPGEIWVIQLDSIKFTDNTLGFGSKINWTRQV